MGNVQHLLARPRPPSKLIAVDGLPAPSRFVPAPTLLEWIQAAYLHEDGALFSEEHSHLERATIGCLWTNTENSRHQRRIVGQAEMPSRTLGRAGKWASGRARQQLEEWFEAVPDFLLTFDSRYADAVDDASFCALVDHELFHCAQAEDEFGEPHFSKATGLPIWTIRGHDVEEFSSVVRRFGIQAAGKKAMDFVSAATKRPEIAAARLTQACGTCLKAAA